MTLELVQPPQSIDAEVSVLGAAMSGANIDDLAAIIEAEDFYHPQRGDEWAAILRVHRSGQQPDPVSVRMALADAGDKHDPMELLRHVEMCPHPGNAEVYAREVADKAGDRRLVDAGTRIEQIGHAEGDLEQRRERARAELDKACKGRNVFHAVRLAEVMPEVIETAEHGQVSMLSTGWPDVDHFVGGLAPGRLVVVGARPGIGKSVMLSNLALTFAGKHKHAVLFSSMEMPRLEVGQRMVAAHASVNLSDLQSGKVNERSWENVRTAFDDFGTWPLYVEDAADQTVTDIRREARNIQRSRDDLALILVDYLQLVRPADTRTNRAEQIGEISRGLKLLARETGACVVAAAQVNRDAARRNDKPRMSDLRESGSIEADADQVLLLHQDNDSNGELEVIVDKNRHGAKGAALLRLYGHYARLSSVAFDPTRGMR